MKNLEDAVLGLKNKVKSAPTPDARFGTFLTEYNDLILKSPGITPELRDLVTAVSTQKQAFVETITHA